jgi:hypothetical protein
MKQAKLTHKIAELINVINRSAMFSTDDAFSSSLSVFATLLDGVTEIVDSVVIGFFCGVTFILVACIWICLSTLLHATMTSD